MSTIVTRAGKGSPLTHAEVDSNFTNLNSDKVEASAGTLTNPTINGTVTTTGLNFDSNTFVIDASGNNVGIGTSSPLNKLHVVDNSTGTQLRVQSSSSNGTAISIQNSATNGRNWRIGSNFVTGNGELAFYDDTSSVERMRLDSSGNLGLGVTPSAWGGNYKALQQAAGSISSYLTGSFNIGQNFYDSGAGAFKYVNNGYSSKYELGNGAHYFYTAPSGTAGDAITFTQAMTLDASGNLGIGTTSPAARLDVDGGDVYVRGNRGVYANTFSQYSGASLYLQAGGGSGTLIFQTAGANERARIDSSGNLLVGTTSVVGSDSPQMSVSGNACIATNTGTTGLTAAIGFHNPNGRIGYIGVSGTTTSYVTSSDYRLKENIAPMTGSLATVQALKPVTYTWKTDGSDGQGFIAHELQSVVPDAVVGEKDAVDEEGNPQYQGIDTSFLVATLTAAIQELKAIVDAQAARITALETK
jgi:hypothetical protein